MEEIDEFLAFGCELLTEAGAIAAVHFRQPAAAVNKLEGAGFDPVTEADREVESRMRGRIEERFPSHGLVGEEYGARAGSSAWSWIVDPIDGTRAFMMGLPVWGCLLGLLRDGQPVAGFMHQPILGETFLGDGSRAWLLRNGQRRAIHASADARLADAILAATHPSMFGPSTLERFQALAARVRMMRYGGDCYLHCLLAHGLVHVVVEDQLKPHDILPLVPIVRGAGGCVTDIFGADPNDGGLVVAAGNAGLHRAALAAMQGGRLNGSLGPPAAS